MTCRIPASPRGKVDWYKDGSIIRAEGRFELLASKHGAYRLVIHGSQVKDSGKYSIVVRNKSGTAESVCDLTVIGNQIDCGILFIRYLIVAGL